MAVESGRLASSECTGVRPASAAGHDERADAVAGPGHDDDLGRALVGQHGRAWCRRGPTRRPTVSAVMVTSSSAQPRGWSASATVPAMAPEATCDEEALLLLGRADLADHRGELGDGGQERPGRDGPAELLDDDRRLDEWTGRRRRTPREWPGRASRGRPWSPRASRGPRRSRRRRARASRGHSFSRNERTEARSSSCSAVNSSSTALPSRPAGCLSDSAGRRRWRQQIGASVPDAHVSLRGLCYLHAAPFSGKDVVGCALGGSPVRGASPGRRRRGLRRA